MNVIYEQLAQMLHIAQSFITEILKIMKQNPVKMTSEEKPEQQSLVQQTLTQVLAYYYSNQNFKNQVHSRKTNEQLFI